MIVNFKTDDGLIYAYAEFQLVDHTTKLDYPNGNYVYVQDIWVHDAVRNGQVLRELIYEIFKRSEKANFVYWHRGEYGRTSKLWPISRLLKFMEIQSWEKKKQQQQ